MPLTHSERGVIAREFRRQSARLAYVPLGVMLAFALVLSWLGGQLLNRTHWVEHTYAVLAELGQSQAVLTEAQSGLKERLPALREHLDRLAALVQDNPEQVARVQALREQSTRGLAAVRGQAPIADTLKLMAAAEKTLLAVRTAQVKQEDRILFAARIGGALLCAGIVNLALLSNLRRVRATYERALDERDQLVEIVEHSSDFIATADAEGRLRYLNAAGRQMIGVGIADDISTLHFSDYVPPAWQSFFRNEMLAQLRAQGTWEGEMQLQNLQSGALIDVLRSTYAIRNESTGAINGFATVTRDITERKRSERALYETSERHRLALEATGLGTWDWDLRTRDLLWDVRCKAIFGFAPDHTVTYAQFLSRIDPADQPRVEAAVRQALEEGPGDYNVEFRVRRALDEVRWVRSRGRVLYADGESGRTPVRMTGAALDITPERARQQELETRVAERTRELTAANERLKELDRLKSAFLASMSHELRTPLNSIIGFTEIILAGLAGPVSAEQTTQLQMSLNSSRHLLSLINDLLDLARIESGRATPHWEVVPVADVVKEVVDTLMPAASRKGLSVRTIVPGPLPLLTDRKMVYQIILNLANNAVKFTDSGAVEILARDLPDAVQITVADTGIGIRPESLPLLFEAFRQVDGSARRRFEGTGLGLNLSQRLAQLLGGRIEVASTFGQGSQFTVTLARPKDGIPRP